MARNNIIILYDLQLASGCTISPFVWSTKYALKHKGFDIEIVPGGFTGILERTGGRSERVPPTLEPLRQMLKESPWLGGSRPGYADYRALAIFLWAASIATTPPLTEDDPLRDWLDRGFDLYGGLGRHAGMHTLFGLQRRAGDPAPFSSDPPMSGLARRNTGPDATRGDLDVVSRARAQVGSQASGAAGR